MRFYPPPPQILEPKDEENARGEGAARNKNIM